MERAVEAPQLHGMVSVEEGVQIQEMVAALVVMGIPVSLVAFVPDALDGTETGRLLAVHGRHKVLVHLLAIPCPVCLYTEGLVEEVVARGDDVHEVADRARGVRCSIEVDVDAAGVVGKGPGLAKGSDDLLQAFDVGLVGEDRADQLDAVQSRCTLFDPSGLGFASDGSVVGELPFPAVKGLQFVGVVVGATIEQLPTEDRLGR